jgi:hypothetical protein
MVVIVVAGMTMMVAVAVPMIMVIVIMMTVIMVIVAVVSMAVMTVAVMTVAAAGIGPPLRIERCLDVDDAGAEPFHHGLDHMVVANAQATPGDLRRQMPIAEMPCHPHQLRGVGGTDFEEMLRRGHHLHQPPVIEHQRVAPAQGDGLRQIEQKIKPARARHPLAAAVAVIEIEHHGIGGIGPAARRSDRGGADHRTTTSAGVMISIFGGASKH